MTKLEEVARAILKRRFYDPEPHMYGNDVEEFFRLHGRYSDHFVEAMDEARAGVEAMRVPSEIMYARGDEKIIEAIEDHSFSLRAKTPAYEAWNAMVDAVLNE